MTCSFKHREQAKAVCIESSSVDAEAADSRRTIWQTLRRNERLKSSHKRHPKREPYNECYGKRVYKWPMPEMND